MRQGTSVINKTIYVPQRWLSLFNIKAVASGRAQQLAWLKWVLTGKSVVTLSATLYWQGHTKIPVEHLRAFHLSSLLGNDLIPLGHWYQLSDRMHLIAAIAK